MIYPASAARS